MDETKNGFWQRLWDFLTPKRIGLLYLIAFVATFITQYYKPQGGEYTNYNNYIIFKQAFYHLIHGKDLYIMYPAECWDLFKYSPAFALFMGVFAWLPNIVGLTLWNLLNAMVLWYAIKTLPKISHQQKAFILLFVFLELLTSIQNSQSNGLIVGLIILAFNRLERNDVVWSSLFIALTIFIKIFGLVAFALFLLYKAKPKFIPYRILWSILLLALVLLWVIMFNHKAESPIFVIAISGVALWYFSQKRELWKTVLVVVAFIFTSLSPTDLFPYIVRKERVDPLC